MISIGNSWPSRCRPRSSSRLFTTGASPVSRKRSHAVVVRLAKRRRDDRVGEVAAERLVARPAERLLAPARSTRRCVPAESMPTNASCAVSRIRCARASLSATRASASRPLFVGDRHGDQVGGRDREVLLVDRPRPRRRRRARRRARRSTVGALAQRHVEHGADVLGLEIGRGELARPRIGPGVVRGDHPLAFDGGEVGRGIRSRQPRAGFVTRAGCGGTGRRSRWRCGSARSATCSRVRRCSVAAATSRMPRSRSSNRSLRIGVPRGERRQRAALRGEPLLAFLERALGAQLLADVVEDRQHGRLVVPGHQPRRAAGPEGAALRMPQLEQHVVGPARRARAAPPAVRRSSGLT